MEEKKSIIKFLLVVFFYVALQFSILIPIYLFDIKPNNTSIEVIALLNLFQSFIFMIVLIFMYKKDLKQDFNDFKLKFKSYIRLTIEHWLLGITLMIISNLLIAYLSPISQANNELGIREAVKGSPIPMLISIIIIAPFTEEIMFRKSLGDIIKNKYLFLITSGLLFGLAHVVGSYQVIWDYLYVIPYGALGMMFALLYYKTKNIYTSVLAHLIHNAFAASLMLLFI